MRKVIVIDDDDDVRESFSMLLSLNNFKVLAIGKDGKEAVLLFQKFKPDLIFLDYNMPNFDGLYALENIKNIDPKSKVIIVTGSIEDHSLLLEKGANAIFSKPFDLKKFCVLQKNMGFRKLLFLFRILKLKKYDLYEIGNEDKWKTTNEF